MASVSSGSFSTSSYSFSSGDRCLTFNWKVLSKSVVNNETVISWELVGGGTYQYNPKCGGFKVTIDGEVVYEQPTSYRINVYIGTIIASGTYTIKHNDDGKRSFTAYAEAGISTVAVNCSGSGTWELPKIPRSSTMNVSDGTLGTEQTITVTKGDADCTHTIKYECGKTSGTICTKSASETISFTPPLDLAKQNTSGPTVAVKFILQTHYAGTDIGNPVEKTVVMAIPASVKPSVTLTVSDDTGYATTYGTTASPLYVKSISKLKIVATPKLAYGSGIDSYKITANGTTYNKASVVTDPLKSSGTLYVKATVTDKRGRTSDEVTVKITVLNYVAPAIPSLSAMRCNSDGTPNEQGTRFKVTFAASITPLNNKNTATYTLKYKKSNDSDYTSVNLPCGGDYSVTESESAYMFAADSTPYDISITATDKHNSLTRSTSGAAALYLIVPHESGNGMGLGMIPTHEGGLDLGFDIYMFDKKIFGMFPVGSVYAEGNNQNPSTKFGGTWSLVNSTAIPGVYFWKRTQ